MNNWTQEEAIALCRKVEEICPKFGCHVALTGGSLYKDGFRKDCDLLFYRIRQEKVVKIIAMFEAFQDIGLKRVSGKGWLIKATYDGKPVDCLFPEAPGNLY